ncbi:MAG TPA: hypothetical protein PLP46_02060 [bacterium]|jgi:hypothetical protein|nr:hypothetical protein [bacterium]HNZ51223.1 hypothetical protein [bacterium]HOF79706.1 hypothetical protein [bacterium]HOH85118.1 hypothetical protein [bacterium]HOQ91683.1 hypothetical protein [bacterium]
MLIKLNRPVRWWFKQTKVARVLLTASLVGWLVLLYLASRPFGVAVYSLSSQSGNYFIHKFGPTERWSTSSPDLIMTGQPGYFFLRPTRPFNQAEITVTWQDRQPDTYLEAGILMDRANWQYQSQPLNHPGLNKLDWPLVTAGHHRLWQKTPVYQTWSEFIERLPNFSQLAVYNWSPSSTKSINLTGYRSHQVWQQLPGQWRGLQQIVTYLADDEQLAWRITVTSDSLQELTADERLVEVNITNSVNQRLWSEQRRLDDNQLEWLITAGPWSAGAYRLEIKASRQLLLKLATQQTVFGWQGQVWPVASADYHWRFWTDAPAIIAQTIQPASRQIILVNQRPLNLADTYQQYSIETLATSSEISLSGGDVQLAGSGIFSLQPTIFNPQWRRAGRLSVDQLAGFDFIAADYQPPVCRQHLCTATAKLSLAGADWQSGDGYQIMLAADNSHLSTVSPLVIQEISVKLRGASLWQFLRSLPRRLVNKLQ